MTLVDTTFFFFFLCLGRFRAEPVIFFLISLGGFNSAKHMVECSWGKRVSMFHLALLSNLGLPFLGEMYLEHILGRGGQGSVCSVIPSHLTQLLSFLDALLGPVVYPTISLPF